MMVVGAMKLFAYEKFKARSEKNGPAGITRGLATFIGVAELAGGLGIVLPTATHIARSLSLWAAVGLSTIMLLAIGFHLRRHESPVAPGILFLLAVFVVFGRFRVGGKQGAKRCPRGNAKDRGRSFEEFRLEPPG
jgi:hypothetical protein